MVGQFDDREWQKIEGRLARRWRAFGLPEGGREQSQLRARWREFAASQPRTELLAEDVEGLQADYVQRSARFRFPDIITVRFISVSASRSTLVIYSRSIYGRSDFGVNRKRIHAWLRAFSAAL